MSFSSLSRFTPVNFYCVLVLKFSVTRAVDKLRQSGKIIAFLSFHNHSPRPRKVTVCLLRMALELARNIPSHLSSTPSRSQRQRPRPLQQQQQRQNQWKSISTGRLPPSDLPWVENRDQTINVIIHIENWAIKKIENLEFKCWTSRI